MRIILLFLLLAGFALKSQNSDSIWVRNNYIKKELYITMRDGVRLFTAIYLPKNNSEKHPFLMVRSPYSAAPYGSDQFQPRLYQRHWISYMKANYIFVIQDVRGRHMSEGEFEDVRPFIKNKKSKSDVDEASDTYDTVDWLVKNIPNNNGNLGVFGISYPGFYSTMAALSNHPAMKAVSPQAPVTEWFLGDDFHHNGAFALMDAFHFYYGFGVPRPKPVESYWRDFNFPVKDNYAFFLSQGALKNFSKLMGDSIKFWNSLMQHPDYDDWWKARDARRACKNIKPAMLVVGGLFDAEDCYGAWNLYKAIEQQCPGTSNRLVMGPWFHGGWHRGEGAHLGNIRFGSPTAQYYQQNIEIPFFEHHLRAAAITEQPEALIFFSGENSWKALDSWPSKKMAFKNLYLEKNNTLSFEKPAEISAHSAYTSDPAKPVPYAEGIHLRRTREYMTDDQRFAARRTDVLVFQTGILKEDLTLGGPVIADLKVSLSTSDADFVVKLIDVFPDDFSYDSLYCCKGADKETEMGGYQMLVRGEIFRGRYRKSFENPEAFSPGKTETVKFELPDVAHTFQKGHRLMIQIQSSWFPLFDRNPQQFVNIYQCSEKDFIPCNIKVFHQQDAASLIQLPVVPK